MLRLIIGNRNYSSWSLRAWLYMRLSAFEFEVERVPLYKEESRQQLLALSPAGRVPILVDADATIWESMAIIDHLQHKNPRALAYPTPEARAISAEMHGGFMARRNEMPMNIRRPPAPKQVFEACGADVERVIGIWTSCRERYAHHGPWLFATLSIADVMYAPEASRFQTYAQPLGDSVAAYRDAILESPAMQEWQALALAATEHISAFDE